MTKDTIDAARTEQRLLQAVLEQLPVGVVVVDAAGAVMSASGRAETLVGGDITAVELYRPGGSLVSAFERPIARALATGASTRNELFETVAADGRRRLLSVSAAPVLDADGRSLGAVSVFDDVTARVRRERAERDFIANAAHELRTPVAAIMSAVDVLQAGAKELPPERDRFLGHVEREAKRLARLGRALLLLARMEIDGEKPRLEIVPMRPLLDEIAGSIAPITSATVEVDCDDLLAALTCRDLVEQALANLAANAVHHTSGGTIILAGEADGRTAVLEVRDSGPGIGAEETARAFDRFYRGRPESGTGFGLGLSIARQAIAAAGGEVELGSVSGRGTTATIRLPLARLVKR